MTNFELHTALYKVKDLINEVRFGGELDDHSKTEELLKQAWFKVEFIQQQLFKDDLEKLKDTISKDV